MFVFGFLGRLKCIIGNINYNSVLISDISTLVDPVGSAFGLPSQGACGNALCPLTFDILSDGPEILIIEQ